MNIKKIILADDDEDDIVFFQEALSEVSDTELIFAKTGKELISIIHSDRKPPDIIFLNTHILYKDKYSCIKEIKEKPTHRDIPIAIYTDSSFEEHINEAFQAGANLYITKPVAFQKLKQLLVKVFSLNIKNYLPQPKRDKFVLLVD